MASIIIAQLTNAFLAQQIVLIAMILLAINVLMVMDIIINPKM